MPDSQRPASRASVAPDSPEPSTADPAAQAAWWTPAPSAWARWQRGLLCWATFLIGPLGWLVRGRFIRRMEPERLDQGLVLILPGIEGRSFLNIAVLQGLLDAGCPYAVEIVDWTTGNKFLTLYHLRAWRRNLRIASQLADRITAYRQQYPDRPVWIIGHSGGGGMALLTLEALPACLKISGAILIAAAASTAFDVRPAMKQVTQGIWSFHSWLDCIFVGLGTIVFGTIDGRHSPAAGMIGFRPPQSEPTGPATSSAAVSRPPTDAIANAAASAIDRTEANLADQEDRVAVFEQIGWTPALAGQFNLGGHFGGVHRVFIAESIAPILARSA